MTKQDDKPINQSHVALWQLQDIEETLADATPEELPELHSKLVALSSGLYDAIVALIKEQVRQARIDELKVLEPPEQFAGYNSIMGSEFCRICGFNSEVFRKHINDRISQLEQEEK